MNLKLLNATVPIRECLSDERALSPSSNFLHINDVLAPNAHIWIEAISSLLHKFCGFSTPEPDVAADRQDDDTRISG